MAKSPTIKSVKGMNDLLPAESPDWLKVESIFTRLLRNYGYAHIRTPIAENTALFLRSIGADTDIVGKEMYTFEDRNGESLTLRPEGTASTVRAGVQHGLFYNQQQRLWYMGPMFRREKAQKGRYRQFHQLGVEAYGWSTPDIEAEVLGLVSQLFKSLGLQDTHLQINSLGDQDSRQRYRTALVDYLQDFVDELDEDSVRRLTSNPLRILDSKNPNVQKVLVDAPSILDFLSEQSQQHFTLLQSYLDALDIEYQINPKLVRGLDYYNDTVFEWVNESYGAQATVCAGGRYDGMVAELGGQATPAFGFGMGIERLVQMLQEQEAEIFRQGNQPEVYLISQGELARAQMLAIQQSLIAAGFSVQCHMGDAGIKNQFKRADKSGAKLAIVIGEEEAANQKVAIKALRKSRTGEYVEQQHIDQNQLIDVVTDLSKAL